MTPAKPSCRDCRFHRLLPPLGSKIHLCTLPPNCAGTMTHAPYSDGVDWEDQQRTYLGTSCHVMRRSGAVCGPHATLWCSANAPAHPAPCVSGGDKA